MDDQKRRQLETVLRDRFPKTARQAYPLAAQLAELNFGCTVALLESLRRRRPRTKTEIAAQKEERIAKLDAKFDALVRAVERRKLGPVKHGPFFRWPRHTPQLIQDDLDKEHFKVSITWIRHELNVLAHSLDHNG
jgi:hypothetical protein